MSTVLSYKGIDDALGPRAQRFFGDRYRGVTQQLRIDAVDGAASMIAGRVEIGYPATWSVKNGKRMRPHVSTIDGVVVAELMATALLRSCADIGTGEIERAWLSSIRLAAGSAPQEDSTLVTASGRVVRIVDDGSVTRIGVAGQLGSMRMDFEVSIPELTASSVRLFTANVVGEDLSGVHHVGAVVDLRDVVLDGDSDSARADLIRSQLDAQPPAGTLAAAYPSHHGDVEHVVTVAQAAQASIYEADHVNRAESNTLWMRGYRARRPLPPAVWSSSSALTVTAVVDDRDRLVMDDAEWSISDWTASCGDVTSGFEVAHRLPAQQVAS